MPPADPASQIDSLRPDARYPVFESAIDTILLLQEERQGTTLEALANRIPLLPSETRYLAFVQVADAIARMSPRQRGASLGVLTRQIPALPIEARYLAFLRADGASSTLLGEEQLGVQTATLVSQIRFLPVPVQQRRFMDFIELVPTLPHGQRSAPMEALTRQIMHLPEDARSAAGSRLEAAIAALPDEEKPRL
jgi:hypothetical protein